MTSNDERNFENPYPDFNSTLSVSENSELKPMIKENTLFHVSKLLKILEDNLASVRDSDNSVYTGTAGIAYLYLNLSRVLNDESLLSLAKKYCDSSTRNLRSSKASFLCGDAGPLAIAAVVYKRLNQESKSKDFVARLESLHGLIVPLKSDIPDELLYGRAGYLYSLLFVQHHLGKTSIRQDLIQKVVESIIISGQRLSAAENKNCPLFYKWHGKAYVGAAHGIVGILYVLLLAEEYLSRSDVEKLIVPTLEFLISLKFPSGNFPSSLENLSTDKLIHWCHGAPGVIHLFAKAYQVLKEERYLSVARECCQVIWNRGLLKKGFGLCHGVAGNAYAFLTLYQITREESYLYRAVKFCEWCYEYGHRGCPPPDRPFSLFEGLAGSIYFMADTINPLNASLPAFSL